MVQAILSDTKFLKVDRNGFHYQAILAIPESSVYSIAELEISFDGTLTIASTKQDLVLPGRGTVVPFSSSIVSFSFEVSSL